MKTFASIFSLIFLIACNTSTDDNESNDQLLTVQEGKSYVDKEFVLNLIDLEKKGHLQQLTKDVVSLMDQLAVNNILSDDEVERLEFTQSTAKIHFQHLSHDLNLDQQVEHIFVLGAQDSGVQLMLVLSEKGEEAHQFHIVHTELLGSQYDPPAISIIEQKEQQPILNVRVESSPGTGIARRHDTFYKLDKPYFKKTLQLNCGKQMNGTLQTETLIDNIEYIGDSIHVDYFLRTWVCPSFSTNLPIESPTAWENNSVHDCMPDEYLVLLRDFIHISFALTQGEKEVYLTTYDKEKLDLLASPDASEEYAKKLFLLFEDGVLDNSDDTKVTEVIKWLKKRLQNN